MRGSGAGGSRWNLWAGALLLAGAAALTGYLGAARAGTPGDDAEALTDSARSVRQAREACGSLAGREKQDCYQGALSARLRSDGVGAAMTTLEGLYAEDRDVERDAHVYAHHIGIEAYALAGSVVETFSECSDMFSSGCYHGVIQAYFEDEGTIDSASVNGLCEPYEGSGQSRWILFQCLHGMGHGLTMHHGHDLIGALDSCDLLERSWDRQSCYGGAFMENVMAATAPHHPATLLAAADEAGAASATGGDESGASAGGGSDASAGGRDASAGGHAHGHGAADEPVEDEQVAIERDPRGLYPPGSSFKALDRDDPHYPCSIVDARYGHACYQMQTSAMLHLNGGDIGDAAESCMSAPAVWRATCYQSLGRDITAHALQDAGRVLKECRKVEQGDFRSACYVGAVKALVDWRSAPEPGLRFCRNVEGAEYKDVCYQALGEEVATLVAGSDERASLCEEAEAEHVEACRRGARLPVRAGGKG